MWPFRRKKTERSLPASPDASPRQARLLVTANRENRGRVLRARYDAAQTSPENARHWAMADALSADAAGTADVRRRLRERARYEVANNSYAKGIVLTLANDCVGTGPRLQLLGASTRRFVSAEAPSNWSRGPVPTQSFASVRTMPLA